MFKSADNMIQVLNGMPFNMSWNGGVIEKRLNSLSTFMWQDHFHTKAPEWSKG